jgi:hypothetical protein
MVEFYNREIRKIYENMVRYDNRDNDYDDIVEIELENYENVLGLFMVIELLDELELNELDGLDDDDLDKDWDDDLEDWGDGENEF